MQRATSTQALTALLGAPRTTLLRLPADPLPSSPLGERLASA